MSYENNIQVKEGYYGKKKYNTLPRFISYFYQVDSVSSLNNVKKVLEIGPGSKLVANELKNSGYEVITCDFDESVKPDIVADVRALPFSESQFDCIMACQILEHIPFEDFENVMKSFSIISGKYVIISLPRRHTGFEIVVKIPFIYTLFKRTFFNISLLFPVRFPGFKESDQHYWEIDFWTTRTKDVESVLKKYFTIEKKFRPVLNKYHQFYVLKKR